MKSLLVVMRMLAVILGLHGAVGLALAGGPVTQDTMGQSPGAVIPAATTAVLYDQMDTPSGGGLLSQDFETTQNAYDSQAADDFVVPVGQVWTITGVAVVGDYNADRPASFNVYFYQDGGGIPGAPLTSALLQGYTGGTQSGALLTITLTAPVSLAAGTYWVSTQARLDNGPGDPYLGGHYWYWERRNISTYSHTAWQNPGEGFYSQCATWAAAADNCPFLGDLRFRLNGALASGVAPTIAKEFAPTSVATNASSTLTITLNNSNATAAALTADLVDTFPAGLGVAATPNAATTCVGGAGVTTARDSVTLGRGAAIPAAGSCTVSVAVSSPAAVAFANSIAVGALQTDAGTNAGTADATLTVTGGGGGGAVPTITKAFAPTTVAPNATSRLTITLNNSNATANALTADLIDIFPSTPRYPYTSDLLVAATPNGATTCTGGAGVTTTSGSVTLGIGAVIPATGSCVVSVDVTSPVTGTIANSIPTGALQTNDGTNAASADAMLTVTNSGGNGTFPQDENFDEVTAPALPAGWTTAASGAGAAWITSTTQFDTALNAAYVADINGVGDRVLDTPTFTPPGPATVSFRNRFYLYWNDDGGVLEISINGSAFEDIIAAGGTFVSGGYNDTMATGFGGPLDGRPAWTGLSKDLSLPNGITWSFLSTVVTLPETTIGQPTVLRFRAGADSNASLVPCHSGIDDCGGWWIDTLHMSFATLPGVVERFSPTSAVVLTDSTVTITLSNPMNVNATLTANFVDTLPTGLVATAAATTCIGGAGASHDSVSITLGTGAVIPAFGSCAITATMHAATAGLYTNTIGLGAVQTTIGNNPTAVNAMLTVTASPSAVVTPIPLALTVQSGTSGSGPLHIANTGAGNLHYVIGEGAASAQPHSSYKTARSSQQILERLVQYGPGSFVQNVPTGSPLTGPNVALRFGDASQMADNSPGDTGVSCASANGRSTADNSWWRRFYFSEHPEVGASTHIGSVTISSGSFGPLGLPITINLYTIPHGTPVDTIPTASLTPIGSVTSTIDSGLLSVTIPVTGTVADTVGTDLVVEYHTDGNSPGQLQIFRPGANATAETHPTFISSTTCGTPEPVPVATIGFPDFHLTMIVAVNDGAAPPICANPADIPWLSETPDRGIVAPGTLTDVAVTASALGLPPGQYTANVCVGSDDPVNPLTAVPVILTVTEASTCHATDALFCNGFDGPASGTRVFTDRATFVAAIGPGFYENPFDDLVPGSIPRLDYANPPWAYTILPFGPAPPGIPPPPLALANGSGFVSVDYSRDSLFVIFTGSQATAIGGNFWAGNNITWQPTYSPVTLTLNDGTTLTYISTGPTNFRGFITSGPITTLTVTAHTVIPGEWPNMDNLIIGTGVIH